MRTLLVAASVALARPAAADPLPAHAVGLTIEGQVIDVGGGQVVGFGPTAVSTLGAGRLQLIAEGGIGILGASQPADRFGYYGTARVGGRLRAASLADARQIGFDIQLVLDAGLGAERYWLDGTSSVDRPYVFFGWGTHLAGTHHAAIFDLRIAASPHLDDAGALRVICRGTCPGPRDAPADFSIDFVFGVLAW